MVRKKEIHSFLNLCQNSFYRATSLDLCHRSEFASGPLHSPMLTQWYLHNLGNKNIRRVLLTRHNKGQKDKKKNERKQRNVNKSVFVS